MSRPLLPVWIATDLVRVGDDLETIEALLAEWVELENRAVLLRADQVIQ